MCHMSFVLVLETLCLASRFCFISVFKRKKRKKLEANIFSKKIITRSFQNEEHKIPNDFNTFSFLPKIRNMIMKSEMKEEEEEEGGGGVERI